MGNNRLHQKTTLNNFINVNFIYKMFLVYARKSVTIVEKYHTVKEHIKPMSSKM